MYINFVNLRLGPDPLYLIVFPTSPLVDAITLVWLCYKSSEVKTPGHCSFTFLTFKFSFTRKSIFLLKQMQLFSMTVKHPKNLLSESLLHQIKKTCMACNAVTRI